jgi:hypothetical protein
VLGRVIRSRRTLRAEELSGDVQSLASHNDDLLAVEQLLGDGAGQATEKVTLAVNDLRAELATSPGAVSRPCSAERHRRQSRGCRRRGVLLAGQGVRTMTGSKVDMVSVVS